MKKKADTNVHELDRLTRLFETNLEVIRRAVGYQARARVREFELGSDEIPDFWQEGYLEVWIKLPSFDDSRTQLGTFADTVARNRLINLGKAARASKRRPPLTFDECVEYDRQRQHDVRQVVASFSQRDRQVCRLLVAYPPTEASRHSGLSRSAFYESISRIRKAFQRAGLLS